MARQKREFHESKPARVIKLALKIILVALLSVGMVAGNMALGQYGRMVNALTGLKGDWDNSGVDTSNLDLDYYKADYSTAEEAKTAQQDFDERLAGEGYVLLKNDDKTMPFAQGTTFSFFSEASKTIGSSQSIMSNFMGGSASYDGLNSAFEAAGFSVNKDLEDFYVKGAGKDYNLGIGSISFGADEDFSINECPLSVMQDAGVLDSAQGTVPVFVMKRVAGEGRDMPRSMYAHADNPTDQARSYLEPDTTEREILQYLSDNYDQVVLLINTASPLELDWLADYPNIKSVVEMPSAGTYGLNSLAKIFSGEINPSGHTVDTYAADALSSPAAQNVGDYAYTAADGTETGYHYVTYAEGIYVGYRYYETRYEDAVLGQGNAGDFDYDKEVVYPFGYGLSYTTFEQSGFSLADKGTTLEATVTVTNTGDVAGKTPVEIYAQSPYTDYDRANGVEKSSVVLVGYQKSKLLEPGESQTVTVSFDKSQLASYDAKGAKTYVMDAGTYYVTSGTDAHDAVNNILAAKGATVDGDASLVASFDQDQLDTTTYATDATTGAAVTNQFDDVTQDNTVYLTRADWTGTFPQHDGEALVGDVSTWGNEINSSDGVAYAYGKQATGDLLAKLDARDSGNPSVSDAASTVMTGADNGLSLIDLRGKSYDDSAWDQLLDQLTLDDYYQTINMGGYGTPSLSSVDKPWGYDADTAAGLAWGGTSTLYCGSATLARTWNPDLAHEYGTMIGNDANVGGANGWYAPSMNLHRTPYVGRANEYYSEDPFVSGQVASLEVRGAAERGVYSTIKHFALNDQENHRGDADAHGVGGGLVTWANEQSIRELYLRPFQMCVEQDPVGESYVDKAADGSLSMSTAQVPATLGVMSSFNRIGATWAGGDYALLTGVLRKEWGFNGWVITDSAAAHQPHMDARQMVEAGGDVKLCYTPDEGVDLDFRTGDVSEGDMGQARESMHHLLYAVANSRAMEGAVPGGHYKEPLQTADLVRIVLNVVCLGGIALVVVSEVRHHQRKQETLAK